MDRAAPGARRAGLTARLDHLLAVQCDDLHAGLLAALADEPWTGAVPPRPPRPAEGRPVEGRLVEGRPVEGRLVEGRPVPGRGRTIQGC